MVFLLVFLGLAVISYLLFWVRFEIVAFRQSVLWGLGTVLLGPVRLIFTILYWQDVRKPFFGMLGSILAAAAAIGVFIVLDPEEAAQFSKGHAAQRSASQSSGTRQEPPREARDLAANESPLPPPKRAAEPHTAERAALAKHSAALNALYAELNKERPTLKKGSPAVAAFNAKAAKYQQV